MSRSPKRIPRRLASASLVLASWLAFAGLLPGVAAAVAPSSAQVPASQDRSNEPYAVKSAAIWKSAPYMRWPESAFGSKHAPLRVAVFGEDPFGKHLDLALKNRKLGCHPYELVRFAGLEDLEACHILIVPEKEQARLPKLLEHYKGQPVLIVGESLEAAEKGACMSLYFQNSKLHVAVNLAALRAAEIVASSELLKLAKVIGGDKEPEPR